MTMTDIIDEKLEADKYYDNNEKWVQLIKDHIEYIRETSTERTISADFFRPYKYNLNYYLRAIAFNPSMEWIVRLINDMPSDMDFIHINTILVPSKNVIKELYKVYQSLEAN